MKNQLNSLNELYKNEFNKYQKLNQYYILIRTFILILFILLIIAGMKIPAIHSYFMIMFILLLFVFFVVCFFHQKTKNNKEMLETSLEVIDQYYKRMNNQWNEFNDMGLDIADKDEYFLFDLDVVGNNSLFQYLNIAKSEGGRIRLLDRLSNKYNDQLENDQKAIKELTSQLEFCIEFQTKLKEVKGNLLVKTDIFNQKTSKHKIQLMINIIFSLLTITLALLSLFNLLESAYFSMSAILQLSYAIVVDKIYLSEFSVIKESQVFSKIYPIFQLISKQSFQSDKMIELSSQMNQGEMIMKKLNIIYNFMSFRNHFLGYVLSNSLLPLNTFVLYSFHKLKEESLEDFQNSIIAFETLESFISLSTIGVCKEDITMPIISDSIKLEIKDIRHPLIVQCISNSFSCDNSVNIITGSNMSGKTSFMRTLGINLILMQAGTFVNASYFQAPYLKIFTSMRVRDDIEKGISTFYGELLRIKDIIDYKEKQLPYIVFIDEIFKGTNYNDRIFGAKEVIKKISKDYSIVFITTHDFELCDMNSHNINNYYFEEYYVEDKIKFDYKIKKGQCKTTNAKFLMKQLNII